MAVEPSGKSFFPCMKVFYRVLERERERSRGERGGSTTIRMIYPSSAPPPLPKMEETRRRVDRPSLGHYFPSVTVIEQGRTFHGVDGDRREGGWRGRALVLSIASCCHHRPSTVRLATTGHLARSEAEGGEATVIFPPQTEPKAWLGLMYRGEREERERRERDRKREKEERERRERRESVRGGGTCRSLPRPTPFSVTD